LFKDHVLARCKAYNTVVLVDFITVVMEKFYQERLESFANSRETHHLILSKLLTGASYISSKDCITVLTMDNGEV